jgi:hypothetical protein
VLVADLTDRIGWRRRGGVGECREREGLCAEEGVLTADEAEGVA